MDEIKIDISIDSETDNKAIVQMDEMNIVNLDDPESVDLLISQTEERVIDIPVEYDPNTVYLTQRLPKVVDPKTGAVKKKRRPRLSKADIFKQQTLPFIILAIAAILIVIFIIGSITRAVQRRAVETAASIAASESIAIEEARLEEELHSILKESEKMAAGYDYEGAIALIDSFSGNVGAYPELLDARTRYEADNQYLVSWDDPNTIVNLSFQTLIADPERAFSNDSYGYLMHDSFVTVGEFQAILEQLYENNYILVGISDFIESGSVKDGTPHYRYKPLMLPEDKKPLVLTQTNVNYNLHLVDSDNDMLPDEDGVGIASRLVLDNAGNVTAEIVNSDGSVTTGAYDLVPVLDAFIEEHPDFSYHGAKAVLALTGYDGLFGYRTDLDGRTIFGEEQYTKDVAAVQAIASKLRETGYELACYTYGNEAYGDASLSYIQIDMNQWANEVFPIIGNVDIMVFAQESDISDGVLYSGEKFDYLKSLGFNYYLGFCNNGDPFTFFAENYVRQGRLLVSGYNIIENSNWFSGIFDTEDLLDEVRYQ